MCPSPDVPVILTNLVNNFVLPNGRLRIVDFAQSMAQFVDHLDHTQYHLLAFPLTEQPITMIGAPATGAPLVTNGRLGADIIRLVAGDGFAPHTHPGDHLLFVVGGRGTITYSGFVYPTEAGQVYMVPGEEPHAVGAITDHVIIAIGSPHRTVDDPERMQLVDYHAITATFGSLHCLICDTRVNFPALLHEANCPHCPCLACRPPDGHQDQAI